MSQEILVNTNFYEVNIRMSIFFSNYKNVIHQYACIFICFISYLVFIKTLRLLHTQIIGWFVSYCNSDASPNPVMKNIIRSKDIFQPSINHTALVFQTNLPMESLNNNRVYFHMSKNRHHVTSSKHEFHLVA